MRVRLGLVVVASGYTPDISKATFSLCGGCTLR